MTAESNTPASEINKLIEAGANFGYRKGRSSVIVKRVVSGRTVYDKRHLPEWDNTPDIISRRVRNEAELLSRLRDSGLMRGRLGLATCVESDPQAGRIALQEVPGKPLSEVMNQNVTERFSADLRRALYLLGRWIKQLQSLPADGEDHRLTSPLNQPDLTDYCKIRFHFLRSMQDKWATDENEKQFCNIVTALSQQASTADKRQVWSHCDFALANVLWDGHTLTPIDFSSAHPNFPLHDIATVLHRLEMLRLYFPWRPYPIESWSNAVLRGYGRLDARESPLFRALQMRHLLLRLLSTGRSRPKNVFSRVHTGWVRMRLRQQLNARLRSLGSTTSENL